MGSVDEIEAARTAEGLPRGFAVLSRFAKTSDTVHTINLLSSAFGICSIDHFGRLDFDNGVSASMKDEVIMVVAVVIIGVVAVVVTGVGAGAGGRGGGGGSTAGSG